jgi:micrococcal nuclease
MSRDIKITTLRGKKLVVFLATISLGVVMLYAGKNSITLATNNAGTNTRGVTHRVVKVLDGDTAEIDINGQVKKVRFIGMDTPEVHDPRKPVQCYGREASARGHELLEGKMVGIEYDQIVGETDKYSRTLAYIILPSGEIYNQKMIAEGYAHEYTYQGQAYKYQSNFKQAEVSAKSLGLGFWGASTCKGDTKQTAK